jgi:MarR family transcriptional regulator, transcriptional regulator for hemolysin
MPRSLTLCEQVGALRRILLRTINERLAKTADRPFVQLLALRAIHQGEVETQSALAERLLIDPPAASRMIARLERDGLLRRSECDDRRRSLLHVTANGRKALRALDEAVAWNDARIRQALSAAEHDQLLVLMAKLQDVLTADADAEETAPARRRA